MLAISCHKNHSVKFDVMKVRGNNDKQMLTATLVGGIATSAIIKFKHQEQTVAQPPEVAMLVIASHHITVLPAMI